MAFDTLRFHLHGIWLCKLAPLLMALPLVCAAQPQDMERYKGVLKEREEVLALLRGTARIKEMDYPDVIQFVDERRGTFFVITKENHPAHPAMVTRELAEENGKPVMKLVNSMSGGDRAAFQRWIGELAARDKMAMEQSSPRAGTQPTLPAGNAIEYKSVQEASDVLRNKPGAQGRREQDGWVTFNETVAGNTVLWAFVPQTDPAFPAVVKRTLLERDGQIYLDMRVLCGAQKSACDKLVREFEELNERMRREIDAKRGK